MTLPSKPDSNAATFIKCTPPPSHLPHLVFLTLCITPASVLPGCHAPFTIIKLFTHLLPHSFISQIFIELLSVPDTRFLPACIYKLGRGCLILSVFLEHLAHYCALTTLGSGTVVFLGVTWELCLEGWGGLSGGRVFLGERAQALLLPWQ